MAAELKNLRGVDYIFFAAYLEQSNEVDATKVNGEVFSFFFLLPLTTLSCLSWIISDANRDLIAYLPLEKGACWPHLLKPLSWRVSPRASNVSCLSLVLRTTGCTWAVSRFPWRKLINGE